MGWLRIVALAVVVVAVLWAIDRALLAAERRGWVYWRRSERDGRGFGTAILTVQGIVEPEKQHVVDERRREQAAIEVAEDDDPLDPPDWDADA